MRIALLLLIALLLSSLPMPASAEEELFDTKAAAAFREQGLAALRHGKYDAAINAFEEAVAASPEADAYYLLGYAYYLKGKKTGDRASRELAAQNFSQAYQIDPNFSPSKFKPEELSVTTGTETETSTEAGKDEPRTAEPESKPTATPAAEKPMSGPTTTAEQPMSEPTVTMEQPKP